MNSLLSAIKAFVLKNRPAYKDYLGNGKYDVKKLPEECVPDSVNNNIKNAKSKADSAYSKADSAYSKADSAYNNANLAYDKASDVNSRLFTLTNLNYNFGTLEYTSAKSEKVYAWSIRTDGISDIPLAESKAPMKCNFDIVLKDSNNNQIGKYSAFDKKIVRGITKISETYRLFIDERTKIGSDGYAELKIGYEFKNDDNLWHRSTRVNVKLPSTDINNANISSVFLNAWSGLVDVDNYAPWPSICVPLAGTNDAGVVYASDKTDDQTVPVSIDKNGYLWCKGSETTTPDWNQNDQTASDYIKNRPFYTGGMVQIEIIPEHTYTLSSAGSFTMYTDESGTYQYSLEDGKNYIVVYNGTTYESTSSISNGFVYVGDLGPLQGSEATLPFMIAASNGALQIFDYNGNTEVTFKIIGNSADIIQIDLKYIPELPRYMPKQNPVCYGSFSLNRKADTAVGVNSHAEGDDTTASGESSHSEGSGSIASELVSHAEGWYTEANARFSHAEGACTIVSTTEMNIGDLTVEDGMGRYGHAEGFATVVTGQHGAHAEGCKTLSSGKSSHAEGRSTAASGDYSHAEGAGTTASGYYSHAEGDRTNASGKTSHAEGELTTASGNTSHAEGSNTIASGLSSHAEGLGTTTSGDASHVQGKYNIDDTDGKYADIVGNGTSDTARSNAHTLDWEGNAWYAGTVEGTAMIVKSSTPNSTKKFKITVDDTGTISATEVI